MPFSIPQSPLVEQDQFTWRPLLRSDLADVYDLLQQVNRADGKDHSESEYDLQQQYDEPFSDPVADARVVRTLTNRLAAFLRIFINPHPKDENSAFLWDEFAPDARGQGLEGEALDWMERRATARLAAVAREQNAQELPRLIRAGILETEPAKLTLYRERGYSHVRSFFKMTRDLGAPVPDVSLPDGLRLVSYDPALDEPLRAALNEAFSDHWGHQDVSLEEWQPFIIGTSTVRRDLTLIVLDGEEVAAFSINHEKPPAPDHPDMKLGWIESLGTRRAWRKRGLASALLSETMRRYRAEGFRSIGLGVDAENPTGALGLYERVGFRAARRRLIMQKRIA